MNLSVLGSGSRGNSILIWEPAPSHSNNQPWPLPWAILVDAGLSAAHVTDCLKSFKMAPADIRAILISHAHGDHWKSLLPIWKKCPNATVFAHGATIAKMQHELKPKQQFPGEAVAVEFGKPFYLHQTSKLFRAVGFACEHNAEGAMTFMIKNHLNRKVAMFMETGKITAEMWQAALGAQVYCIEMNHDALACLDNENRPRTINERTFVTHLNNDQAALAIQHLPDTAHTAIALHLSSDNNDPELVRRIMAEANARRPKRLDRVIVSSQEFATAGVEV